MSQPAVSIILVRKHGEDDLSAIQSNLREQTFTDYEMLVAEPRVSLAAARNQAVLKARGEYLAFIDSDQRWVPAKLEKQILKLKGNRDLSWCYCDAAISGGQSRFGDGAALHSGDILRPLLLKNFIPPGSVVVSREVFATLGGFNQADIYYLNEEWEFWIRLAAIYPAGLVNEPLVQVPYEVSAAPQLQLGRKQVVESAVARHQERLKDLRSESLAEICISAGNAHLKANQRNEARRNFEEALTHSPLRSDAYLSWVSSFLSSEAQRQIRDLHNLGRQVQRAEKGRGVEKVANG